MPRWLSRSPRPDRRAVTRRASQPVPADAGPVLLALAREAIAHTVGAENRRGPGPTSSFAAVRGADVEMPAEDVPAEDAPAEDAPAQDAPAGAAIVDGWLEAPGACFVTLTNAGGLRGCIGSIEPRRSLRADVIGNAVAAATKDRRFPPVTPDELPAVAIEVSVLSPAEPMTAADEADALAQLRPGVDGVVVECRGRRATYLPQVWAKIPDPARFLGELKVKAGLPRGFWSDDLTLSRYTVTEFHEASETGEAS